jgi:nitrate/TMAO reductase-like tetraheme cytochrome c subunit
VVRFRARSRRVRVATSAATLAAGLGIVAMLVSLQLSSTPTFCGTCHIMKPYYQSWKHSSHNRIACVECHISPGIGAEARKKFEALSMVAKYFTGTYGTKPWAEVDDAACLRCHERRLLQGMVVFQGVQFDHTPHLTEIRRGLHLRCTSCHSQIVQGTHLTVTSSTCALCHFKGQGINQGYGRCRRCHEVPEQVATATGVSFDHSQVSRLDLQCQSCHAGVVRGTGEVAPERCLSCHNQPDRLARFGDRQFLHEWHVTRHKVDCQNCHSLIEHGRLPSTSTIVTAEASGACVACHGSGHNPQQDLYAGSGGRGVPRMPSPMFTAGVTCQGCHDPALAIEPASVEPSGPHSQRAGAVSCMSCHGPSFGAIYQRWKQAVDERTEAMRRQLESSAGAMGLEPPAAWEDARHNFALVSKGKGVHNVGFTYALLDKAHEQMNDARRAKGLAPLPKPWKSLGAGAATCTGCHVDIEKQSGRFGERAFAHAPHVVSAQLACQTCHRPHAERAPGEVVRYGSEGCTSCHHRALPAASPQACGRCHGDVTAHTYPSFRGEFSHRQHLDAGLECTSCHGSSANDPRPRKSQCMQCHD